MKTKVGVLVVVGAMLGAAVWWNLQLPEVWRSWSTQACVRVIDPSGVYSCEHPPTIHKPTVWVQ